MAHVGHGLVVGQGVNGGHRTFDDADVFAQYFGNGGEAVGGAGSIGDDGHVVGNHVVVHTVDDGRVNISLARCGNQHFFRAAFKMDIGFGFAGERAGAFHHQVHAQVAPGQFGGVAGGEERDFAAVDDEMGRIVGNVGIKAAVNGIEFGQMGVGFEATAGVDSDDFKLVLQVVIVDGA